MVDNETLKAIVDIQVGLATRIMSILIIIMIIMIINTQVVSGNIFQFGRENIYSEVGT